MKDGVAQLFRTLAWYNRRVNAEIAKLLTPREALSLEEGTTYYGSLLDLLSHVVLSDITWLRRTNAAANTAATGSEPLDVSFSSLADRPFSDLPAWKTYRGDLDRFIESHVGGLSSTQLEETITYANTRGVEFSQRRWEILLHMFNHQTHHRGQIAQVLDDRGIENDVSNIIRYLRDL